MKITIELDNIEEIKKLIPFICDIQYEERVEKIMDMCFTIRTRNCLLAEGINTLEELLNYSEVELLKTPNLGQKSLREIKDFLSNIGLRLKG